MILRFTAIEELLGDLCGRPSSVVDSVVRVAIKETRHRGGPRELTVVVTAKVQSEAPFASAPGYDLVLLESYVGVLWPPVADQETIAAANELVDDYRSKIAESRFSPANGAYELAVA